MLGDSFAQRKLICGPGHETRSLLRQKEGRWRLKQPGTIQGTSQSRTTDSEAPRKRRASVECPTSFRLVLQRLDLRRLKLPNRRRRRLLYRPVLFLGRPPRLRKWPLSRVDDPSSQKRGLQRAYRSQVAHD